MTDTEYRCAARNGDAICFEPKGHEGDHKGVEPDGHVIVWDRDFKPPVPWTHRGNHSDY